jgi:hypothetical protein
MFFDRKWWNKPPILSFLINSKVFNDFEHETRRFWSDKYRIRNQQQKLSGAIYVSTCFCDIFFSQFFILSHLKIIEKTVFTHSVRDHSSWIELTTLSTRSNVMEFHFVLFWKRLRILLSTNRLVHCYFSFKMKLMSYVSSVTPSTE